MVMRAIEVVSGNTILPSCATATAEWSSWLLPARMRSTAGRLGTIGGLGEKSRFLVRAFAPRECITAVFDDTQNAFWRASSSANSPGEVRQTPLYSPVLDFGGNGLKTNPALANSICRARLCEARISGSSPFQMVIAVVILEPLALAVRE